MTTEKAPFSDIFRAMSEGQVIQFKNITDEWVNLSCIEACEVIGHHFAKEDRFRIKPATRTITIEVPEPLRVKPKYGDKYWPHSAWCVAMHSTWVNDEIDNKRFENGAAFATEQDAEIFYHALANAMKPKD